MALLHWNDRYSVGIEAVDYEHKELIDLINQLYDRAVRDDEAATVEAFFGDLLKAISAHFALEERFMRERKYAQRESHKRDHERLLDELRDIMDDFLDNKERGSAKLADKLGAWFTHHFETHDARLHKALGSHPH
jgi:hemerythrin